MPGECPFPGQREKYRKVYERYEPADAAYLSKHRGHLNVRAAGRNETDSRAGEFLDCLGTSLQTERCRSADVPANFSRDPQKSLGKAIANL